MSDPRSRRGADQGDDYEPPASAREVAGVHAPQRPTQTSEPGPSVVVREAGSQQYQEKWSDATVVTKRRPGQGRASMASLSGQSAKRTNWVSIGIWVAVGVAAFGLGGLLTHLRNSSAAGSGTVVQASGPAGAPDSTSVAQPAAAPPTPQAASADEDAAAPEVVAEPDTETLDPSELKQVPKKALPHATAKPAAAPPKATAPKVSAPTKAGIPSEI